jgi:polyferredoxin
MTLAAFGEALKRNQSLIRRLQWGVVAAYALLVGLPAFLDLPDRTQHLWNNLTLFAQFVFWGLWWPLVLIATMLMGRVWCGFFCPEGMLSEEASRKGKGFSPPGWMRWGGWPFAAFALTTIYGQMVSVYQYPKPALLILGGSTLAAILVGYFYGRHKRVWCRYLCPVNGVFGLLAKLSPVHFKVDEMAWTQSQSEHRPLPAFNCAPLVPVRHMQSAAACHMCGRCSGFRDAVALSWRSPLAEIVQVAGNKPKPWESVLILFGLLGVALAAFHWTGSAAFIGLKQGLADILVEQGWLWPLETTAPWWLLTDYPALNDTMTLLDGAALLVFILAISSAMGASLALLAWLSSLSCGQANAKARFHHLVQGLIPLAGVGVVLGLSALSVTILKGEGVSLPAVNEVRAVLLALASGMSLLLIWRIAGRYAQGLRRLAAVLPMLGAVLLGAAGWGSLFWG